MRRILVVDDEFDISEALCLLLQSEGYEAESCANGREAIEYLGSGSGRPAPDLVLVDIMMPFVSGYEVVRFIRQDPRLAHVPVILMSAVRPASDRRDAEWDDFLRKPFNIDHLTQLVARHLARPHPQEPRRETEAHRR